MNKIMVILGILIFVSTAFAESINTDTQQGGRKKSRKGMHQNAERKKPQEIKFADMDSDGNGAITEEEFNNFKTKMKEKRDQNRKKMLEKFDTNNNGKIDEDEKAAIGNLKQKAAQYKDKLKNYAQKKFDYNQDGKLDDNERYSMREEIKKIKDLYDVDKDGKLSTDERKNLIEYVKKELNITE